MAGELDTIAPLGPTQMYSWTHTSLTGATLSHGNLWVETTSPGRLFLELWHVHDHIWSKHSRSGWHGRFSVLASHVFKGVQVFELLEFRYSGVAAPWKHQMEFTWNQGQGAFFCSACACPKFPPGHRHKHIRVTPVPVCAAPLLTEGASWRWVSTPQPFMQGGPPPPPTLRAPTESLPSRTQEEYAE